MKLINVTTKGTLHFKLSDGRIVTSHNTGYIRANTFHKNIFNGRKTFYQLTKNKIMCPKKRYKWLLEYNKRLQIKYDKKNII